MSHRIDVSNILRHVFYESIYTHRILRVIVHALVIVTILCILTSVSTFSGRVIGVADSDTISLLHNGQAIRIRVAGVDGPESVAEFSTKAKKFTFALVYDKSVEVQGEEMDRYRRLVARVFVNRQDLSVSLIPAGQAWHYKQYSSHSF